MALQQSIDLALARTSARPGCRRRRSTRRVPASAGREAPAPRTTRAGACRSSACRPRPGDLDAIRAAAARLRDGASDVVFLGTGGSSLGGQTLAQLADYAVPGARALRRGAAGAFPRQPRSADLRAACSSALPLATSRFVAISKSGGTGETLMQAIAVLSALDKAGLRARAGELFLGLSEPRREGARNGLRDLLEPEGVAFLDHHTGIGGRYSVLTNVGLLPAAVLGLDIGAIRAGAADAYAPIRAGAAGDAPAAVGRGAQPRLRHGGQGDHRAHGLCRPARALHALVGAALGREPRQGRQGLAAGRGDRAGRPALAAAALSCRAEGQAVHRPHRRRRPGRGRRSTPELARRAGEPGFAGRRIGDLVAAQGRATADTLAKNGRPTRRMHVERLDERAIGELLMHFMLETILTGYALGIDPFDQPAVEEGKVLAKRYLAEAKG